MRRRILTIALWVVLGIPVVLLLGFLGVPTEFAVAWILVFAAAALIAQQSFLDETRPVAARIAAGRAARLGRVAPRLVDRHAHRHGGAVLPAPGHGSRGSAPARARSPPRVGGS